MHRFGGHPDPARHEIVRAALKGLARQHAAPRRRAAGLSREEAVRLGSTATMPRQRPGGNGETIGAANRRGKVDAATAQEVAGDFYELICAAEFSEQALEIL